MVTVTDDALYGCPFLMTSDVGTMSLRPVEAARLRDYLLKGGFLWVDDFWGSRSWAQWAGEIAKVLPPGEYPIKDLPLDHSVFKTMFHIREIPQISNIHFWRWSGGATTSERGPDSEVPHFRGIMDEHGRFDGGHDAQHGHPGRLGARRGGPAVLRAVLAGRLPAWA